MDIIYADQASCTQTLDSTWAVRIQQNPVFGDEAKPINIFYKPLANERNLPTLIEMGTYLKYN